MRCVHDQASHKKIANKGGVPVTDEWEADSFGWCKAGWYENIDKRLKGDQNGYSLNQIFSKQIFKAPGNFESEEGEHKEKGDEKQRAYKTNLFSDDWKYEVGMLHRQVKKLLLRLCNPYAPQSARSNSN